MSSHILPSTLVLPPATLSKLRMIAHFCGEVARGLGKGRAEAVYQEALCSELQRFSIPHTKEEVIPILYKGIIVGHERLDIGIRDWLDAVLELKAQAGAINVAQLWQVHSYMEYKRCDYGAVINFSQSMGDAGLEIAFVVKQDGVSYLYQLETGKAIPMRGNGYETPLLEGKMVSDAVAAAEKAAAKEMAMLTPVDAVPAAVPTTVPIAVPMTRPTVVLPPSPLRSMSSASSVVSVSSISTFSSETISPTVAGVVAAAAAVTTAEEGRVAAERKRLQALWRDHKVRPGQPVSKRLANLREGLKEAGVAF